MIGRIGKLIICSLLLTILISGCGAESSEPLPSSPGTPTVTVSPSKTLTPTTPTPKPSPTVTSVKRYVTDDEVRFRAGPSTDAAIFQTLMKGTEVEAIQVEGNWTKVTFEGQTGYIWSEYLSDKAPTP